MIVGLAAALGLLVGTVIGALGGGGGVLAVPALVYLLGQDARHATTGSLLIVGVTALAGALARARAGSVRWGTGTAIGVAGVGAAYLGSLLNARLPEPALLLAFAGLVLLSATAMLVGAPGRRTARVPAAAVGAGSGRVALLDPPAVSAPPAVATRVATIALVGLAVGFLTGLLGVGGGFLVLPALVLALRMPLHPAVGTSLVVIAVNSVAALGARTSDLGDVDWAVIAPFAALAVAGGLLGKRIAERLPGQVLNRAFAVLLLLVGGAVAVQSVVALVSA